jgi:hypothetical protein
MKNSIAVSMCCCVKNTKPLRICIQVRVQVLHWLADSVPSVLAYIVLFWSLGRKTPVDHSYLSNRYDEKLKFWPPF